MKMMKRTQQYGELANLSNEASDQQVNAQRSDVLAMVNDSVDRLVSSQLQEFMNCVDILDELKCLAWAGSIKSNVLGKLETSRESCRV